MQFQLYRHIVADPDILSGQPVVEGTQVTASTLITGVAAGKSLDAVAGEHGVTAEDVRATLEFAAQRATEPVARDGAAHAVGQATNVLSPAGTEEARRLRLDPSTLSPLGKRLLEQRAKIRAAGIPMLTWEQLDAEIAEQRGSEAE